MPSAVYGGLGEGTGQGYRPGGGPALGQLPPPDSPHPKKLQPQSLEKMGEESPLWAVPLRPPTIQAAVTQ